MITNPAITFDPLCPDCGHEMFEINGRFECLNADCENLDLKAPDPADAVTEGVVERTAVTPRQDKESGAQVEQKGDFSAEY